MTLEQDGDYAFRVSFDDTALEPLLTDESAPLGHDGGPNPSRLLLASVANCLIASLLFVLGYCQPAVPSDQAHSRA